MCQPNNFRHQRYSEERPTAPYRLLRGDGHCDPENNEFAERMRAIGERLRQAGVCSILLTHGTFAGPDAFGLIDTLGTIFGKLNKSLKGAAKKIIDALAGDMGNFTNGYVELLQNSLNAGISQDAAEFIHVERFHWSSENNHIGRADGAVRLIEKLAASPVPANKRRLLIGHSHGGNVLALMTNLLNADGSVVAEFFDAAKAYYKIPATKFVDAPHWPRVRRILLDDGDEFRAAKKTLRNTSMDLVTLGTPIRYGWDLSGQRRLLHFVNHKTHPECAEYLARFPQDGNELMQGELGDLVHIIGIAGTNIIPNLLSPRAIVADQRLNSLLQSGVTRRQFTNHIKCCMRVAEQGTTLLVDYDEADRNIVSSLAGHAVYTRLPWMEFHLRCIAAAFASE